MSVSSVGGAQNTTQFVQQLVSQIDGNQDGQISSTELGSFLTTLMSAVSHPSSQGTNTASSDSLSAGTATEASPSTWTDNNAPYGVTLAGFSPQDHTNLTLDDLANNTKYAVYSYLLTNQVDPNTAWAPAAADALNEKYGTDIFKATRDDKLVFAGQYVHSAPNGHGMLRGTYNPNATGELLWGVSEA